MTPRPAHLITNNNNMKLKEWLGLIGLGGLTVGGGILGIILLALAPAIPIIAIIWVVWKLFF